MACCRQQLACSGSAKNDEKLTINSSSTRRHDDTKLRIVVQRHPCSGCCCLADRPLACCLADRLLACCQPAAACCRLAAAVCCHLNPNRRTTRLSERQNMIGTRRTRNNAPCCCCGLLPCCAPPCAGLLLPPCAGLLPPAGSVDDHNCAKQQQKQNEKPTLLLLSTTSWLATLLRLRKKKKTTKTWLAKLVARSRSLQPCRLEEHSISWQEHRLKHKRS